jgi:lipopolysaccharide/colanic/teichoic acid biosynthesis glycosyltransferase
MLSKLSERLLERRENKFEALSNGADAANPKFEYRNPKQIRNSNNSQDQILNGVVSALGFLVLKLFRVSDFVLRIYRAGLMKRIFDIVLAALGLLVLSPLLLLVAVLIKLDSQGPVLFKQERIGKSFRPFFIYKFRTMVEDAPKLGGPITYGNDFRITRAGRILRKAKLDELPQLLNVLKGEMSFVGPRPEVPRYVEMFREDYHDILKIRPGITDLASIKYRAEAALLAHCQNPEEEYVVHVLPDKIRLAKEYRRRSSFFFDLTVIFKTLRGLLVRSTTL